MIRFPRAALALACALTLAAPPALAATPQWPQARSDLKADPDIRFGVMPNGLRYAIRKQSTPPGQTAIRLWIHAGSIHEAESQQGLAHFLEHMAFNGSRSVKEGEMIKMLERLGLSFGGDTNASTGFSETVYRLDLPRSDDTTIDTSLMLLREAASNLTIDKEAVQRERGVVLSEERARDTPGYRITKARLQFLLKGQRLPERLPIGQVEVLKSAPPEAFRAFYERWYRPERSALIVVGDFDPAAMEAKVRRLFSDWQGTGPAGEEPDQGPIAPRKAEAKLVIEPGAQPALQIAWVAPPDNEPDSVAKRRRQFIETLGLQVLNRRYSSIARDPNPPFLGAYAYRAEQEDSAEIATVSVTAEPGRWQEALAAAEREQRRIVQFGVLQEELDREIEGYRAQLKAAVGGAATRRQAELAGEILMSLADNLVVTAPADDLALFERIVKDLKAETVSAALKTVFQGEGPLVFMASPTPVEGGESALLTALTASQAVAVTPPKPPAQMAWPYESFGAPGKVAETREVKDLGTTFVRFENGVRLTVKPTAFRDDEVLVRVNVGRGLLDLPSDRPSPAWASSAFIEGGLKKIEAEDLERVLASRVYDANFGIGDDAFVLSGGTRPADLAVQLQILAAYVSEPGWREAAFQRIKAAWRTAHDRYEATDNGVLSRDLAGLLHSGDRRWTVPSREELAQASLQDLSGTIGPALAQGPLEVVIVGDVTVKEATDLVARTFGALPRRPDPQLPPEAKRRVAFPPGAPQPVVRTHKGRGDQSIGYVAWPTTDFWENPQRARQTAVLGEVLRLRLYDELREVQGATYSPDVSYNHSLVWEDWGLLSASVEVPPAKLDDFFADVTRIAAELRAKPPSEDELDRAKKPRVERLQKAMVTNQFWLSELSGAQADPRKLDMTRSHISGTEKVTAADVQRAAATFLDPAKAFKLVVRPETGAAAE